jgi:hypothetical protein
MEGQIIQWTKGKGQIIQWTKGKGQKDTNNTENTTQKTNYLN